MLTVKTCMRAVATILAVHPGGLAHGQLPANRVKAPIHATRVSVIADSEARVFVRPVLLAASARGFTLLDADGHRIEAFDTSGRHTWTFGQTGGGPGEFRAPTDIQFDSSEVLWVSDPANGRVSAIRPDGSLALMMRPQGAITRIAPIGVGDGLIAASDLKHEIAVRFDSAGAVASKMAAPTDIDTVFSLARESQLTRIGHRATLIYFRWASRLLCFRDDGALAFDAPGVDDIRFPAVKTYSLDASGRNRAIRIDPRAREVALSAAATSSEILVLSAIRVGASQSLIDRYRIIDGKYIDSFLLDARVDRVAWDGKRLYGLAEGPEPMVFQYRLQAVRAVSGRP